MPSVLLDEIKQRLEQITSACGRIVHVAKVSQAPRSPIHPGHIVYIPQVERNLTARGAVYISS